jgi:predicted Ser/Thr protein kinase
MSNESSPKCPQCGAPIKEGAPAGLCPNCLMRLNLKTETVFSGDAPAAQAPLPSEQIAPHFPQLEIFECLGRGGMGVVYRARQKALNRFVALKLLAPERVGDAKFAERFAREAQALAALNHPNIVTIYDFGQAGGFYYLLMEFVDGANLRRLLRERKFKPEEALAIVPPLCDALQFAHDHGIVHRDIKPENLLLDKAGRVKIADFGIAKMLDVGDNGAAPGGNATQTSVGTPGYSAPEQMASSQRVDNRADIYSLGVVFYEMLTGELPRKPIEPPSKKVHMDVRLDEVVLRALEEEPGRRYQHVSQVKSDVETIAGTPPSAGAAPASPPPPGQAAKAPESIKVFAVLNIILGAMGVLCCSPYLLVLIPFESKIFSAQPLMMLTYYVCAILALPLSCVTLASGIGLLYRKSWARKLAIWKGVSSILFLVCVEPIVILSVITNTVMPADQKKTALVANLPVVLVELVYWVLLIFFLTRKPVKQALGENP